MVLHMIGVRNWGTTQGQPYLGGILYFFCTGLCLMPSLNFDLTVWSNRDALWWSLRAKQVVSSSEAEPGPCSPPAPK